MYTDELAAAAPARQAQGLLVAGRGPTVSREEAARALEGIQSQPGCEIRIVLGLPSRGEQPNDQRYPILISGPGYDEGILDSSRTHVPGLISIYDVKPTVEALENGRTPPITARTGSLAELARLDQRLDDVDDSRTAAGFGLAAIVAAFTMLAALRRSAFFGRAALLAVPAGLGTVLALSALDVSRPWTAVPILVVVAAGGALGLAALTRKPYALAAALLAIFPLYLVVLGVSQETSSLAMIGPRPENGGRFYGFNNQLETLVLAPAFLGAALLGPRLLPFVGALAVITVGASFAGADGGGVIVLLAGFLFLWLRLRDVPLTARNLALAGAGVVALGLAIVGIDAVLGGESHVTRSLGGGPDQVVEDVVDRLHASVEGVASNWHTTVLVAIAIPVLAWVGLRRPRNAVLDALLVALAVSLVVNDAPREVLSYGALSALALRYWCENAEAVE